MSPAFPNLRNMNLAEIYKKRSLLIFLLLAVIICFCISLLIGEKTSGFLGDIAFTLWTVDSDLGKFKSLDFTNFFSANIFYPYTNTLAFSDHLLAQTIIALPVYLITGSSLISYNFTYLLSFVISFLGMYLLGNKIFRDKRIALLLGMIFTFCIFRFSHLGMFQLQFYGFFPLSIYFFEEVLTKKHIYRDTALLAISSLMLCWTNIYFEIFFLILIVSYFIPRFIYTKAWRQKRILLSLLISGIIIVPLILITSLPYLELSRYHNAIRTQEEITGFSADVFDVFFSYNGSIVYGFISKFFRQGIYGDWERSFFVGAIPLLLAIAGFVSIALKHKKYFLIKFPKDIRLFYLFQIVLFVSIAWGPVLRIAGREFDVVTPFDLIARIFYPLQALRAIARIYIVSIIFLTLLSGYGLKKLFKHIDRIAFSKHKNIVVCLFIVTVSILIPIEHYGEFPTFFELKPITENKTTEFLSSIETGNFIFLPAMWPIELLTQEYRTHNFDPGAMYMLYTLGNQENIKIMNGYSGYFPPDIDEIQVYIGDHGLNKTTLFLLSQLDVQYIGVDYDFMSDEYIGEYQDTISELTDKGLLSTASSDQENNVFIYKINTNKLAQEYEKPQIKSSISTNRLIPQNAESFELDIKYINESSLPFAQTEKKHRYEVHLLDENNNVISKQNVYFIEPIIVEELSTKYVNREIKLPRGISNKLRIRVFENGEQLVEQETEIADEDLITSINADSKLFEDEQLLFGLQPNYDKSMHNLEMDLKVQNNTDFYWFKSTQLKEQPTDFGSIQIGLLVYDQYGQQLSEKRCPLPEDLASGESAKLNCDFDLPKDQEYYHYKLGLVNESRFWIQKDQFEEVIDQSQSA